MNLEETPVAHDDDLLWRHLKSLPAFRALLRAVEARFYRHIEIPEPVLDLGCGDGNFAQMAFDKPLAAGIDPWWGPLKKSEAAGTYQTLVQGMGDKMPFADGHFASVMSNSVLEHIPDIQPVLQEVNRVLRPGGQLIITMPSHYFTKFLAGNRLFGESYSRFFNFISRHAHTDPPEKWAERLALAGFAITRWQYYFSPGALRALEWGHYQGVPSAVLQALTGQWILAPWKDNLRFTERWVRPFYEEEPPPAGAYILIIAEKQANGPIEASLPAAQPFTAAELTDQAPPIIPQPIAPPPPLPTAPPMAPISEEASRSPLFPAISRSLITTSLLVFGLLLAVAGQGAWLNDPTVPRAGLSLFAYAFLLLGGLSWLRGQEQLRPGNLERNGWFYPAGLVLVLIAQRQGSAGQPTLALLLWLLGIGAAGYALAPPLNLPRWGRWWQSKTVGVALLLFLLAFALRAINLTRHPFILNGVEAQIGLDSAGTLNGLVGNPFATGWLTNPTLLYFLQAIPLRLFGQTTLAARILPAVIGSLTVPALYLIGRKVWSEPIGLVAALFLAGSHAHLHYSRLGMTNIWDPFWALLALGSIAFAWQRGGRTAWLLAGLFTGLAAFDFTTSHLLPFILLGLLVYGWLVARPEQAQQRPHILAGAALCLVVMLPMIVYYNANPTIFMERANSVGIFSNNWLADEAVRTGRTQYQLLGQQLWQSLLAFNATLDSSTSYNPGIPLFRFWLATFFSLGVGLAIARSRQLPNALLLLWLGVTFIFGGALLISPPDSHRLLVALPAACLLAASFVVWLAEQLTVSFPAGKWARWQLSFLALLAFLLIIGDALFYFGTYRVEKRFGDRNTEIAYEIATYLNSLDGEWTAYFYGPPTMYVGFPTIPFLATNFQENSNLFNVEDPNLPLQPLNPDSNLVFIYLPERVAEMSITQQSYPAGQFKNFEGQLVSPLFFAYEVRK